MREQSGQLLYFLSGFLTLQLEIQNFLASVGVGMLKIDTSILPQNSSIMLPSTMTSFLAESILSVDTDDIYQKLVNSTKLVNVNIDKLLFNMY